MSQCAIKHGLTLLFHEKLFEGVDGFKVLAQIKELGADSRLTVVISGESVMNDGCAVVLFALFYDSGATSRGGSLDEASVIAWELIQCMANTSVVFL